MNRLPIAIAIISLIAILHGAHAEELEISSYTGWVVRVLDGDTIKVLDGGNRVTRVRLKGIDAPEKDQPFGDESREHLASMLSGKEVRIEANSSDDFGNILGTLLVEPVDCEGCKKTLDVNLSQLNAGLAWWLPKFAHQQSKRDRKAYEAAEQQARKSKTGLWADAEPVAPWQWRERTGIHTAE